MKALVPFDLEPFVDPEQFGRLLAIPEDHYYGITVTAGPNGHIIRARCSPTGDHPYLIKIDGGEKTFFCTCAEFQKKVSYPARMGPQLCDHLLRILTILDQDMRRSLGICKDWRGMKNEFGVERREITAQAEFYLESGDTLSALTEIFFGIQSALLRDLDVADLLEQLDVDSVSIPDLPEAMRFARVALQKGFARKAGELAEAWMERFALNVDSFAPFEDVAPVAIWLKRWSSTPDVHFDSIRQLVLAALEKAKQESAGASWWLLYRATSRSGQSPPENAVKAWLKALANMKLALFHPDRINSAAKLLSSFGITVSGAGFEYEQRHGQSVMRAKQWRMSTLVGLAKAHQVRPFLTIEENPYVSDKYINVKVTGTPDSLGELILSTIGYKGTYITTENFIENWPIILQNCRQVPELSNDFTNKIRKEWPKTDMIVPKPVRLGGLSTPANAAGQGTVVRWAPSSPKLIANSPLVAHHKGRIYIPARGGSSWPDMFGLTLCSKATSVGRRLFTLRISRVLNAAQAVEFIKNGASFIGPGEDPVNLMAMRLQNCSVSELISLPQSIDSRMDILKRQAWFPDRLWILDNISARRDELGAWCKRRLWEVMAMGNPPEEATDVGFLFGQNVTVTPDQNTWETMITQAIASDNQIQWIESLVPLFIEVLPFLDSSAAPLDVGAIARTALAPSIPTIVNRRQEELAGVRLELDKGYYDLTSLKSTIFGSMVLEELDLWGRSRIRKNEAKPLLNTLAKLQLGVKGLPLFSKNL